MMWWAVLAAALAGWWSLPRRRASPRDPAAQVSPTLAWCSAAVAGGLLSGGWCGVPGPCLALLALAMGWLIRRRWAARRSRRRRDAVVRACRELAGQLRLGMVPAAGVRACDAAGPFAQAAAWQQVGGDVVTLWRREANVVGEEAKLTLARAWEVSVRTGAPLGEALTRVSVDVEREGERRQQLSAELAGPRMTSTVLACLPLVGMVLGVAVGADPWDFLTSNPFGQVALFVATALTCGGLAWNERLASRTEAMR